MDGILLLPEIKGLIVFLQALTGYDFVYHKNAIDSSFCSRFQKTYTYYYSLIRDVVLDQESLPQSQDQKRFLQGRFPQN